MTIKLANIYKEPRQELGISPGWKESVKRRRCTHDRGIIDRAVFQRRQQVTEFPRPGGGLLAALLAGSV